MPASTGPSLNVGKRLNPVEAHRTHQAARQVGVGNPGAPTAKLTDIWGRALPEMSGRPVTRLSCRALATLGRFWLQDATGWEHILPARDPFILAPNHGSRQEALLLPALLALHRQGRQVHFLADWNFLLWPLVGSLIRMNDPIIITRKPARPRCLNVFKPLFKSAESPFQAARRRLLAGQSLGIFPEGTVNQQENQLLRGQSGAARLSLETGAPVIPMGLQRAETSGRSWGLDAMMVRIGRPLQPDREFVGRAAPAVAVRQWHQQTMQAIADLSGKTWHPHNPKTKYAPAYSNLAN